MEDLEREEQAVDDIEVVIVPPDPDEVTDEEDVRENDLTESEVQDVAGIIEVFVRTEELSVNGGTYETLPLASEIPHNKKRKTCAGTQKPTS
ncbi:hypothetical protein ANN_08692 [Periplaneta americana]|uniref:Uncharacterized protein n=1 Tax=Periplaneta americana TaxID=6978 RepID=A0ABQ8T265_PERAM|nr:hypothetical protein ANN_08692 [Periplaneta americana]